MNAQLEKALSEVTKLDSWDITSVLGGVNYIVQQAAINTVLRQIPEPPAEGSGMENYTAWEMAMKSPAIKEAASPIVGVADRVKEVLNEYTDRPVSEYEDVLKFMLARPPKRETFVADYDNRKRMGMRPSMPVSTFVDMEMVTASQRYQLLVAKGEAAVHILQQMEGSDAEIPEWLQEAIHAKILQKLEQRWMRAELRKTNTKIPQSERDIADANQRLIESVITELGSKPPDYKEELAAHDELDAFIERVSAKPV